MDELEICINIFTENDNSKKNIKTNNINHKLLLKEWLERSNTIGLKGRCLKNFENNNTCSEIIGYIEGLTNEGYLRIKTESGQLMTHMSGDIFEIK